LINAYADSSVLEHSVEVTIGMLQQGQSMSLIERLVFKRKSLIAPELDEDDACYTASAERQYVVALKTNDLVSASREEKSSRLMSLN
jgi:hypothetical protein